tara:strand:- start:861 stop:1484 length:624 start_codon:yes stop_codon:yes gene_type:complete
MNLIAVEASTDLCSVASFKDGILQNVIDLVDSKEHSKNLPHIISQCMNDFDDYSEIDAFAVSIGPGSFTSVRISISIIKGLTLGLKNDIVPVSTLEAMNYPIKDKDTHHIVLNSYKKKCFVQKFKGSLAIDEPFVLNLEDLDKINNAYIYSKNTIITNNNFITPSAISLGNYAIENYKKLVKKYNEKIKPIYLSENKFVKIDDNKSK